MTILRSRLSVTKLTPLMPRGMVVAEHPLGAEVGAAILTRGGNAVDAAVATAFAMTVVEPFMSTIAGSGTMLIHRARKDETIALDFNAAAPLAASETMFRVVGGRSDALFPWPCVEERANEYGPRSVAVPGSVAGLTWALAHYGTMELADVLQPAIRLAREGFDADWYLCVMTAKSLDEVRSFPETARTYLRNGDSVFRPAGLNPADRIAYPDLARSLELLARDGADAMYKGALGQAIVEHLAAHGGVMTMADLAAYRIRTAPPLTSTYRGVELAWSPGATGGITGLEILNILEQFPAAQTSWHSVTGLHHRAEAVRRAFLDRLQYLGDAETVAAPWQRLASKEYAKEIATALRRRGRPAAATLTRAGATTRDCTTHVGAIDRDRNMVALTHTAVSLFGSRMVVPGTGILLNNGMIWFDPEPGKPNSIRPGRRGLVNMVPALGFKRGEPWFTVGAPGGRKIVSAIPQVIANLVDGRGSAQAAVEAPRLHSEGDEVVIDVRVGAAALAALARRGLTVVPKEESYSSLFFSKPVAIRVTRRGLEAGLDHLRPAAAAGH